MFANKKNLAIIAILVVLVVIAAVFYFVFLRPASPGGSNQASVPAPAPSTAPPGAPAGAPPQSAPPRPATKAAPGLPARPGAPVRLGAAPAKQASAAAKAKALSAVAKKPAASTPGAAAKKPGQSQVASADAPPASPRPDPFVIPGSNTRRVQQRPTVASIVPNIIITNWQPHPIAPPPVPAGTSGVRIAGLPNDRVAGIMMNNGVYAIMDANGQSQVVQPGDTLPGGERVISIQSDSVTLRTAADQTINLPISAGYSGSSGSTAGSTTTAPAQGIPGAG